MKSLEISECWIYTKFTKKEKAKETQQLEQTQFYGIVFDFKRINKNYIAEVSLDLPSIYYHASAPTH